MWTYVVNKTKEPRRLAEAGNKLTAREKKDPQTDVCNSNNKTLYLVPMFVLQLGGVYTHTRQIQKLWI